MTLSDYILLFAIVCLSLGVGLLVGAFLGVMAGVGAALIVVGSLGLFVSPADDEDGTG